MAAHQLVGFGEEIVELEYDGFWDWFIRFRSPVEAWRAQPTYLLSEYAYLVIGLVFLAHACKKGGRWPYMLLGSYLHGLVIENICFVSPDIDNYWHSQTTVMLLGRRLSLHITFIYPVMEYAAHYAVAQCRLPRYAQPLLAGLLEVLVDIPYDIMCIKFAHWTWHDTDPNIYDRHYWVPWNSYYFHLTFGVSFYFFLHFWRRRLTGSDDLSYKSSWWRETLCSVLAAVCGMPGGIVQFIPLYHPLHDNYGVHSENTFLFIFFLYVLIVWTADRNPNVGSRPRKGESSDRPWVIVLCLVLHYSVYLAMAVFFNPEDEVSIGLHERLGPCNETSDVHTAFGQVLKKRKWLCAADYDEAYFDFHCLPDGKPPKDGVSWYTICGTPYPNKAEYVSTIVAICVFAAIIFWNLLMKSGLPPREKRDKIKSQ